MGVNSLPKTVTRQRRLAGRSEYLLLRRSAIREAALNSPGRSEHPGNWLCLALPAVHGIRAAMASRPLSVICGFASRPRRRAMSRSHARTRFGSVVPISICLSAAVCCFPARGGRVESSAMPKRAAGATLRSRAGPARPAVAFVLPPSPTAGVSSHSHLGYTWSRPQASSFVCLPARSRAASASASVSVRLRAY